MDPHEGGVSAWYRTAGLASRNQKDLAVEIIEGEIRSAQHEVLLEAAVLVLSGDPRRGLAASARAGRADDPAEGPRDMTSLHRPASKVDMRR